MKRQAIILRGLPASGKSTWAKQLVDKHPGIYKRVSRDNLREMVDNGHWSKTNEKFIVKLRDDFILLALAEGFSPVIDDTNLSPQVMQQLRDLVTRYGETHGEEIEIVVQDFTNVSPEECIKRDQKRPNYVGEKVIRQMHRQYLQKKPEPPAYDPNLPSCIICDIDGTLAIRGDRSPYEWHKVELDTPNVPVRDVLWRYEDYSYMSIILLSGRDECCRDETTQWLHINKVPHTALYMRREGDNRKDAIVKRELYDAHIKGKYNVHFILDDRSSVIRLWRDELGLPCFQVNDGDF